MQEPDNITWLRRSPFLHGIQTAFVSKLTSSDDGLSCLLLDGRLLRCKGALVSSFMAGAVTAFLTECCEDPACPKAQVYGGEYPYVR